MSSKYINNDSYASSGYTFDGTNQSITIGPQGTIGGTGLVGGDSGRGQAYAILNFGTITGGIYLGAGGVVTNTTSGLIEGPNAVALTRGNNTVSNSGTIEATSNRGVSLDQGGGYLTNSVSGLVEGAFGVYTGGGRGTVSNAGTILGTYVGSLAAGIDLGDGGRVTNTGTSALIEGGDGVRALDGTIRNAGTIEGTGSYGSGVYFSHGGTVVNGIGGLIVGRSDGVSGANTSNAGTIKGNTYGVSGGNVSNSSSGLIEGGLAGVSGGDVTNAGTIKGGITSTSGAIVNRTGGLIEGGIISADTVTNAGKIEGGLGVYQVYTVTNSGTIDGTSGSSSSGISAIGISSVIKNGAGALIVGSLSGVTRADTVVNAGTIKGSAKGSSGVSCYGGILSTGASLGDLTNNAGGLIEGNQFGVTRAHRVINAGTILGTGSSSSGVALLGGVVDNDDTAALIEGGKYGVAQVNKVINDGTIEGTAGGSSGAVLLSYGNYTSGYLSGGVIVNSGTAALIKGSAYGVLFGSFTRPVVVTVTNTGTIEGTDKSSDGISLTVQSNDQSWGTITNDAGGLIAGGKNGVFVNAVSLTTTGTVINTGMIEGGGGSGIVLRPGGIVLNRGSGALIEGGRYGVVIGGAAGAVTNSGTIEGNDGIVIDASIGTVINTGTIEGTGGAAVIFESANDVLVDQNSGVFIGQVRGDGGTLELAGTNGTISGFGTQFIGFSIFAFEARTSWTIAGTNTVAKSAEFSASGTLIDTGSVTVLGSAALAGTIGGGGTLSLQGHSSLTGLGIAGSLAVDNFGTIEASGRLTIGDPSTVRARFVNEAGGVFDITADTGIGRGTAASTFTNAGTIEKTVSIGTSSIKIDIANSGTIEAETGRLTLDGAITGTGTLSVASGATLEIDSTVGGGQVLDFNGGNAAVVVVGTTGFNATLDGFSSSDHLDLAAIAFGAATKLTYQGTTSGGALTVTNGTDTIKVKLFGQYTTAGFHDRADKLGGTLITYVPPPARDPTQLATSH